MDDHDPSGHGTSMAGMVLHGDLTAALADTVRAHAEPSARVREIASADGFDPNEPHSYGVLTQAAIALPEIEAPERPRIYCMAVTNEDVSGATASTWSAAIDQAAVGRMIADDDATTRARMARRSRPKRLIIVSAGNVVG